MSDLNETDSSKTENLAEATPLANDQHKEDVTFRSLVNLIR